MMDPQKQRFRDLITERLQKLAEENALGKQGQTVVTLDQQSVGRLSRQDALLTESMAKATQARRDAASGRLRQALERLNTEDFGYCDDCGDEIALKRLEFDPSFTLCITCAKG